MDESSSPVFFKPEALITPDQVPAGDAIAPTVAPRNFGLPDEIWQARVPLCAALRAEGYTYRKIAKALGMNYNAVAWCIRKARERDILKPGLIEAANTLDNEIVPMAVDAIARKVARGEEKSVLSVLEGRGLLRNFSQVKSEGDANKTNMAFQFVFTGGPAGASVAAGAALPEGLPGQVFGQPRSDE